MILGVYAIKDVRAGFSQPSFELNDATAMRNFANACMQGKNLFKTHAADFELFKVGEYDNDKGVIIPCEHKAIIAALDVVKPYESEEKNE